MQFSLLDGDEDTPEETPAEKPKAPANQVKEPREAASLTNEADNKNVSAMESSPEPQTNKPEKTAVAGNGVDKKPEGEKPITQPQTKGSSPVSTPNDSENPAPPGDGEGETPPVKIAVLSNTGEGCWKILSDGNRQELSDAEWRTELKMLFSKEGGGD